MERDDRGAGAEHGAEVCLELLARHPVERERVVHTERTDRPHTLGLLAQLDDPLPVALRRSEVQQAHLGNCVPD